MPPVSHHPTECGGPQNLRAGELYNQIEGMNKAGDTTLGGSQTDFPETSPEMAVGFHDSEGRLNAAVREELTRRYWKPVYRYIRVAWGKSNEDAKDLTQAFFLNLIERGSMDHYERQQGSLRTFLKVVLRNFVINREIELKRLKRGGGERLLSLDNADLDFEAPAGSDPEKELDRAWAVEVAEAAIFRVRARFHEQGRDRIFEAFETSDLRPAGQRPSYQEVASQLGIKENDVRNHLATVRRAVREEIRRELGRTTVSIQDLESEWHDLFGSG